jgi:sigma-B regulation protein RsbU (phosphoserine phosphatase)
MGNAIKKAGATMICGVQNSMPSTASQLVGPCPRPAVLVSEDHDDVLAAISLLLKNNGFEIEPVKSPAETLAAVRRRSFDAVLLDLNYSRDTTSGVEGLELISQLQALDSGMPIIVMTAWGTIELAVEAMHRGASDFVQKPWENARMLEVLRGQMQKANERRQTRLSERMELEEAAQIQKALLPARASAAAGLTISAATHAVRNVSGDYYDVIPLDQHRSAICIADVMGKGMGAALLMSNLQATVRLLAPQIDEPQELCSRLNRSISSNGMPGRFITFFYGIIDVRTMKITYTNAGHNWPVLAHADGACDRLRTDDAVLGTFWNWTYRQSEVDLRSGDRLALFTDGITECADASGNEFGEEQLCRLISDNVHFPAAVLEQLAMSAVQTHSRGSFADDATLVVAAFK